jgi:hypothetical protein
MVSSILVIVGLMIVMIAPQRHIMMILLKHALPLLCSHHKELESTDSNFRDTRNGSGCSSMDFPVTMHEVHLGVKQDKMFYQDEKDGKDFREQQNEHNAAVTQF